jgi:hypothetical protein
MKSFGGLYRKVDETVDPYVKRNKPGSERQVSYFSHKWNMKKT